MTENNRFTKGPEINFERPGNEFLYDFANKKIMSKK